MPHVDLLELPYFDDVSLDELLELVDAMEPREFKAGEMIVKEGDTPHPLFVATHGCIEVTKLSPKGENVPLAELEAPTPFGEIEFFCGIPAVASSRAITRVCTFTLRRLVFEKLLEKSHPAISRFAFNVARVACHRLAIADEMLAQVLGSADLVEMRRIVFSKLATNQPWDRTTGVFERPKKR